MRKCKTRLSRRCKRKKKTTKRRGSRNYCRIEHLPGGSRLRNFMTLNQLQDLIRTMYGAKDSARGIEGTYMWFMEEVGELSGALRGGKHEATVLEFADVLAWLATLANV